MDLRPASLISMDPKYPILRSASNIVVPMRYTTSLRGDLTALGKPHLGLGLVKGNGSSRSRDILDMDLLRLAGKSGKAL